VQNAASTPEPGDERDRQVQRVIFIEGGANLVVLLAKLAVGLSTGSIAVLGDAFHSLTDAANNGVAWIVMRLSALPADEGHPYGHRKFETLAVFVLAMLLTIVAFELGWAAVRRSEPSVAASGWGLVLMLGVLIVNCALTLWEGRRARQLESDILRADARHTLADVGTTLVVMGGWQAAAAGYAWLDTLAALGISALIFYLAYDLFRRSIPILVDHASIDPQVIAEISGAVPGVLAVPRVRSRGYGSRSAVDLIVTVAPELSTTQSHAIATAVENALYAQLPVDGVVVHVEPDPRAK